VFPKIDRVKPRESLPDPDNGLCAAGAKVLPHGMCEEIKYTPLRGHKRRSSHEHLHGNLRATSPRRTNKDSLEGNLNKTIE
jgi:hypothetical protein